MSQSRRKPLQPLANSLQGFLRNLGIETKVKEFEAIGKWPVIVGKKIAAVTTAEYVSEGVLFVKVNGSAWRNELIYMKLDILDRINHSVGKGIIKDIRYI